MNQKMLIGFGVVLLLAVVGGAAYWYLQSPRGTQPQTEDTGDANTAGTEATFRYPEGQDMQILDVVFAVPPYSSKKLAFVAAAMVRPEDIPYKQELFYFDKTLGKISYRTDMGIVYYLLRLYPQDVTLSLEEQLTRIELDRRWGIQESEFRNICKITKWNVNGTDFYRLAYDENKYRDMLMQKYASTEGEFFVLYYCSSNKFSLVDELIVEDFGHPIDASEIKVWAGSVRLID